MQERQQQQTQIDDAVKSKMTAQGDLESGKWRGDPSTGSRIASALAIFGGGIGAGLSAAGGHPTGNLVLDQINKTTDREYEAAKDRLNSENESVLAARYGYKDTADNQRAALNDLDADFSARHKLIAAQADNELKQSGLSPEQRQAHELVAGSLAKSAQYEDNIHAREIEAGRKNEIADSTLDLNKSKITENESLARMHDRQHGKGAGGGGGGGADAEGLSRAIRLGVDDGKGGRRPMTYDEQLAAAKQYKVPPEAKAGHVSLTSVLKGAAFDANQAAKEAKNNGGVDPTKIVRDLNGKPLGLAPSGKGGAAAVQSDMRTNMTALTQLERAAQRPRIPWPAARSSTMRFSRWRQRRRRGRPTRPRRTKRDRSRTCWGCLTPRRSTERSASCKRA